MTINGNSRVVGILADPIGHVRTPQLFNASMARQGLDAVCVPFHVKADGLVRFLEGIRQMESLAGIIVTIPYKERVVAACDELSEAARLVGSANCIRREDGGRLVGGNFDGDGFVSGLKSAGHDVKGRRVLLLGAGGAGKSIALAIAREAPAQFVIHNRTPERAVEAAERIRLALPGAPVSAGADDPAGFDLVINATALGLRDGEPLPLDPARLGAGTLVCEAAMRDGDTALLAAARARGCRVHLGQHMLLGQIVSIANFLGLPLSADAVDQGILPTC